VKWTNSAEAPANVPFLVFLCLYLVYVCLSYVPLLWVSLPTVEDAVSNVAKMWLLHVQTGLHVGCM